MNHSPSNTKTHFQRKAQEANDASRAFLVQRGCLTPGRHRQRGSPLGAPRTPRR